MSAPDTYLGQCFCGTVQIEALGMPLESSACACAQCRGRAGNPLGAFMLWLNDDVRFIHGEADVARHGRPGQREFYACMHCGSHLLHRHAALGVTDVRPGVLTRLPFLPVAQPNHAEPLAPILDDQVSVWDTTLGEVSVPGELVTE